VVGDTAAERIPVTIVLTPQYRSRSDVQVAIDVPRPGEVTVPFTVAGWALDRESTAGTGITAVHVWAYPVTDEGHGQPVFLGAAQLGGRRPDVAALYGPRFDAAGYGLSVSALAPGTYDVAVFALSALADRFAPARVVRVIAR
jgi:hypothetical protein